MQPGDPEKRKFTDSWAVREVDHLLSRFTRYTRFVLYSKWFLGVFALLLMGSLILWPLLTQDKSGVRISFIGTETKDGGMSISPVMNNPVYEGTDKKGGRFKVTGGRAIQQSAELIIIEKVEGQLLTKNQSWVSLTADRADYEQAKNSLILTGNVILIHDAGYSFTTPQAMINTETMAVYGNQQIRGDGPMGNLLATGFEIRDNGNRIRFGGTGRVNVHLEKSKQS